MGNEGPGQTEYPWIPGERSGGELRQLPVVTGRQIGADLANLLFDQIIIVDQPFRRRRDRAPLVDRLGDIAIGMEQRRGVVGKPARQRMTFGRLRRDWLCEREAPRVLLQALAR